MNLVQMAGNDMLMRLLHASRAVDQFSQEEPLDILSQSKANDPERGIAGVLCSSGPIFLQCLDGRRMPVNALNNQIAADPRQSEIAILSCEEVSERKFAKWSMGLVNLEQVSLSLLLKHSESASLDPYGVAGTASMALLHESMARASIMGQTHLSPPAAR